MPSTSKRLVLVLGSQEDPHINAVARQIGECGGNTFVLDPSVDKTGSFITYRLSKSDSRLVFREAGGGICDLKDVTAVWWRMKPTPEYLEIPDDERITLQFCIREWRHVLEPLEVWLQDATWVNRRPVDREIRYKPAQLFLAQKFGFEIPDTAITNDSAIVADLLQAQGGEGIYKPLTWFFKPPDKTLFTNSITADAVQKNPEAIERAPGIFQPRIPKAFELRITVVGERIFPIRIDSQRQAGSGLDWRRKQLEMEYVPFKLPTQFPDRLLSFHRSVGLVYGAYDFIVTPDDRYVFLEVNPTGQWLWIEERTEAPISRAIAEALL